MTFSGADEKTLMSLVRAEVADVMGLDQPDDVPPDATFGDLGLDSMAMVELSSALTRETGLDLFVTIGFDYPTPAALAGYLHRALAGVHEEVAGPAGAGERTDPVVIVGMSCRFPGGVRSPEDLFALVARETDAVSKFPEDRGWPVEGLYDPDPAHPHTTYTCEGGFVDDVDAFDAAFFGIGPREATAMDPQHRLLLETAWEAFEHARVDPGTLRGTPTGVFVGLATKDYYGARATSVPEDLERHFVLGNAGSVASGRIAYVLGLEGPAITVDTACSSSLVAVHLACSALRQGECSMALAGGASLYTTPETFITFSRQRSLSAGGRCRAYGSTADGTAFGEGVGFLVLERRSDARRLGHRELAAVRGSAINQDGASSGLTAPHGPSQERVIRRALADARLAPGDIDVVEGHGTGTTLGDPIEARSLLATYGTARPSERPLWLGSLKSNIGHAQAAAGVGGIIKLVMAMRHGLLPRTLHVDEPTPHVDWSAGAVKLLVAAQDWPRTDRPRRGAVSAFGISGTNAHVILEEASAEAEPARSAEAREPPVTPWVLSARTPTALRAQAARLRDHVDRRAGLGPTDIAQSLVGTRASHEYRAVALGRERGELLAGLAAIAADVETADVVRGRASHREPVAFVFPGAGTHWPGMARELRATSPVFASCLQGAVAALAPHLDWSLEAVLDDEPGAPSMARQEVVQPTQFAVMISLAALWRSFGVEPAVVIGHSQGEVAAAYVAGALTLEDAARLVARRGRTVARLAGRGGMLSVGLPVREVRRRLDRWDDRLGVAAINGPASVVVSGDASALQELLAEAEAEGLWTRLLPSDVPGHSPHVEELRELLLAELAALDPRATAVAFASTVTGSMHDTASLDAEYWFRNLRCTVRFADAVLAAAAHGCRTFIEVSPHPVLTFGVAATLEAEGVDPDEVAIVGSLRRGDGAMRRFATSVSEVHTRGLPIEWAPLLGGYGARNVDLPTYAFDRSRFWLGNAGPDGADPTAAGLEPTGHPLLGAAIQLAGREERLLTGRVALALDAWIADHVVMDAVLLPGTAFVELALRAGREAGCAMVEELTLEAPLVLCEDGAAHLQVWVGEPDDAGRRAVTIASRPQNASSGSNAAAAWTRHASGTLDQAPTGDADLASGAPGVWPAAGDEIDVANLYDRLLVQGVDYGPTFRGLRAAWRAGESVFAEVSLEAESGSAAGEFEIHPALLDAAFHAMGDRLLDAGPGEAWLPFSWRGVRLYRQGATSVRAKLSPAGEDGLRLVATDEFGAAVVTVDSVVVRKVTAAQLATATATTQEALSVVDWRPFPGGGSHAPVRVAALDAGAPELDAGPPTDIAALAAAVTSSTPAPDVVLASVASGEPGSGLAAGARRATHRALDVLQRLLTEDRLDETRLAFLTRGAVSTASDEAPDPVAAAVWGLARAARAEHPGRILLVDVDETLASSAALTAALSAGEPELAIRNGRLLAPALVPAPAARGSERRLDPAGTVLVTGGLTGVGASVARHLVQAHGVRHLLLVSRRGASAPQATDLQIELTALGAEVTVAACDVSDRDALAGLIARVPSDRPLTGVVHSAGVLDDGVITSLTPEKLDRAMRPKVDAGAHLHALTEHLDLGAFVLFSSIAGTFGGAAQGNYSAANAFLDALAQRRHAQGLAGTSIAWGLWAETTEMGGHLDDGDRARLARLGVAPLPRELGLALFDAALELGRPLVVAARLDTTALRSLARLDTVPPLLRGLAGPLRRPAERGESLTRRLAGVPEAGRPAVVLDLVRTHVAAILGHGAPAEIDPQRAFKDLGFDSIGAVELRNRLAAASGLRLSSTLVFDHPSAAAVAAHLLGLVPSGPAPSPVDEQIDRLEGLLDAVDESHRDRLRTRVRGLLDGLAPPPPSEPRDGLGTAERLRVADADELFALIDGDLKGR